MKRFGIVSYNIYCNFTNYGSALQSYALQQAANAVGEGAWEAIVLDYCPDLLADKNPVDPFKICGIRMKSLKECVNSLCPPSGKTTKNLIIFMKHV